MDTITNFVFDNPILSLMILVGIVMLVFGTGKPKGNNFTWTDDNDWHDRMNNL